MIHLPDPNLSRIIGRNIFKMLHLNRSRAKSDDAFHQKQFLSFPGRLINIKVFNNLRGFFRFMAKQKSVAIRQSSNNHLVEAAPQFQSMREHCSNFLSAELSAKQIKSPKSLGKYVSFKREIICLNGNFFRFFARKNWIECWVKRSGFHWAPVAENLERLMLCQIDHWCSTQWPISSYKMRLQLGENTVTIQFQLISGNSHWFKIDWNRP